MVKPWFKKMVKGGFNNCGFRIADLELRIAELIIAKRRVHGARVEITIHELPITNDFLLWHGCCFIYWHDSDNEKIHEELFLFSRRQDRTKAGQYFISAADLAPDILHALQAE